jgi:hypothetical protein
LVVLQVNSSVVSMVVTTAAAAEVVEAVEVAATVPARWVTSAASQANSSVVVVVRVLAVAMVEMEGTSLQAQGSSLGSWLRAS